MHVQTAKAEAQSDQGLRCPLPESLHANSVFAKTAGLSDKTSKFSFCPAENFSLSDKCPVILVKKRL